MTATSQIPHEAGLALSTLTEIERGTVAYEAVTLPQRYDDGHLINVMFLSFLTLFLNVPLIILSIVIKFNNFHQYDSYF